MQLGASKRHASARPVRPLHKRLARRRAAQARLFAGGVVALAASVAAWLFGLTLPLHLGLLALGFAVGFFWRFAGVGRRAERWAFGWIEPRAGLSYETAFELPESDTSALSEAVRLRAARAERLGTPPLEPWALPPLVLALALAAVPHFVLPTLRAPLEPLLPPVLTAPPDEGAPPAEPEAGAPEPEAAAETATPETDEPESGSETPPEEGGAGDGGSDPSFSTDGGALATGSAPSESATLEQFLEGSGAAQPGEGGREASGREAQAAAEAAAERGAADESTRGGTGTEPGRPSADALPDGDENAPANAGEGEPSADDPLQSTNRNLGGARPSGAEDEATAQEGGEAGAGEGAPPDAPDATEQQGASSEAGSPGEGDGASQPGEAADGRSQTGQGSERGSSDEAGRGSGGEQAGSGARLPGGAGGDLERLTGRRTEGVPNLRAETLQQGDVPGALPRTGGPERYRRAAEEVVREGRIPLEYQQIVRDYFR